MGKQREVRRGPGAPESSALTKGFGDHAPPGIQGRGRQVEGVGGGGRRGEGEGIYLIKRSKTNTLVNP